MIRYLSAFLILLFPSLLVAQEMPIVAYLGVPVSETSYVRYRQLRDCGFNTSISFFGCEREVIDALNAADSAGIKLIPYSNAYLIHPQTSVPHTDSHPALAGYLVWDEPNVGDLPKVKDKMERIVTAGAKKPCYVNLHPYYSDAAVRQMGARTYSGYVRQCMDKLELPFLSFDHYPVLNDDSIRATWYGNLQIVRDEAKRRGCPFWGFVLSTPHAIYPQPTMASLRLQVNANLIYGAQGIQYYTYWLPREVNYDYHDSPIDGRGEETETYRIVQRMNQELSKVSPMFLGGSTSSLKHVYHRYKTASLNAPDGAIGALLTTAIGDRYMVFVNKSLKNVMSVRFRETEYSVEPGGILLLAQM